MTAEESRRVFTREKMADFIKQGVFFKDAYETIGCSEWQARRLEETYGLRLLRERGHSYNKKTLTKKNFAIWKTFNYSISQISILTCINKTTVGDYAKRFKYSQDIEIIIPKKKKDRDDKGKVTRVKCKATKKVVRPDRKIDELFFMPWVSNSQPLKPDHGIAA